METPMPDCPHVTIRVEEDHIECTECHTQEIPLAIDGTALHKFLNVLEGIFQGLDQAGMTDVAKMLRERACQLTLNHQLVWRPHGD